uniref:hypothetical protein n=1 Tax=Klebsiella pneumoniae TaxID=573 RepID=UPI0023B25F13
FMMVLPKQNTLSAYRYRVGVTISLSPVERPGFLFLRLKRTPSRKVRGFLLCGVYLPPVALRLPGLQKRTPDKVRSTASGENYAMFAPLSPFNAK